MKDFARNSTALRAAVVSVQIALPVLESLQAQGHPWAANSLLAGLAETLTLQRLGVRGALYRTLRSTNAIENLNGGVGRFARNVKNWQGRDAAALGRRSGRAPSVGFRRMRGHADMPKLNAALDRAIKHNTLDRQQKAA